MATVAGLPPSIVVQRYLERCKSDVRTRLEKDPAFEKFNKDNDDEITELFQTIVNVMRQFGSEANRACAQKLFNGRLIIAIFKDKKPHDPVTQIVDHGRSLSDTKPLSDEELDASLEQWADYAVAKVLEIFAKRSLADLHRLINPDDSLTIRIFVRPPDADNSLRLVSIK